MTTLFIINPSSGVSDDKLTDDQINDSFPLPERISPHVAGLVTLQNQRSIYNCAHSINLQSNGMVLCMRTSPWKQNDGRNKTKLLMTIVLSQI